MDKTGLIHDIDRRIRYVETQVRLGAAREDMNKEQSDALLSIFSNAKTDHDAVIAVNEHLAMCSIWTASQLAAFSACLRLSATRAPHVKCGSRAMQRNLHLEFCGVQSDWDKLMSLSKNDTRLMTEVVAARMHKFGLECPSPDT